MSGQQHASAKLYPGKDSVPILQEAGWALGPVWTGGKSRPHPDSIPGRPARSQSLYRLSYPAHAGDNNNVNLRINSSHSCHTEQVLRGVGLDLVRQSRSHMPCGNIPALGFPQSHQTCLRTHVGLDANTHSRPHSGNAVLMRSYCVFALLQDVN